VKATFRPPPAAPLILVLLCSCRDRLGPAELASQEIVVGLPIVPMMVSVLTVTGVGFFVKYLLEKRWVFLDGYNNHVAEI
jgi:putative flippase GtrA